MSKILIMLVAQINYISTFSLPSSDGLNLAIDMQSVFLDIGYRLSNTYDNLYKLHPIKNLRLFCIQIALTTIVQSSSISK